MNNLKSNDLSGDLNYIVTEYISRVGLNIPSQGQNNLLEGLKENLNFGRIYDIDLNEHECNYETRREIYKRVENQNLNDIYSKFRKFLSESENIKREKDEINKEENSEKFKISFEEKRKTNLYKMIRDGKISKNQSIESMNYLENEKMRSFKHMKSILGHISLADENMINPVPIYCISYSIDNQLIFTGDNNGLIKIWSSKTGALVDIFKSHEKAINDILLVDSYLISCSEDMSVKIWDINRLSLIKTINFDESIIRVLHYEYNPSHNVIIANSLTGKVFLFDLNQVFTITNSKFPLEYENETFVSKIYFDKKIIEKFNLKKIKNNIQQSCMATHNKSGILVCGFNEGLVCVWDLNKILEVVIEKKRFIHEFEKYVLFLEYVHSSIVQISEFNKIGDFFFTASVDGLVLIWKVQWDVIDMIRHNKSTDGLYPIYSIFKIAEGENKMRCSVNAANWSVNNNFVFAMISSRNKKRSNFIQNNQNSNEINEVIPTNSSESYKRSSAILIYDIHKNSIIKRLDSENGFSLHDECYVLESHPTNEHILLTVTNSNEIIIVNFLTGEILGKFIEENYFFNNVSHNMVATEGKFSSKGDSFVISTYLGSISIYNIYSKNSFSTTYMNQFLDEEFSEVTTEMREENKFIKNVDMYNLPYVSQQPTTQHKLKQMEENIFPKLLKNYNYSSKEIQHKMMNNYEIYDKNQNERRFECEREEKIFIQSAKENLGYFIPENVVDELESEEEVSSEYHNSDNVEIENQIERNEEEDLEDLDSLSEDNNQNQNQSEGVYNLRSRNHTNPTRRRLRMRLRNRSNLDEEIKENEVINNNSRRRRLRRNNVIDDEEMDLNDSNDNLNSNDNFSVKSDDSEDSANDDEELKINIEKYGREISNIIQSCKDVDNHCYLCKFQSKSLIGPFTTEDNLNFNIQNIQNIQKESNLEYENYYFHIDCVLNYNDFIIKEEKRNIKINLSESIRNIIEKDQKCWRCLNTYATKKCQNCDKYFHGFICLEKYSVENESIFYCLDCYQKNFKDYSINKIQLKYNSIPREFYLIDKFSFYSFYPQLGDKVYFILHAYEEFLKKYYQNILMEVDDVFFWNEEIDYRIPFLCEIIKMDFAFPNNYTINLFKRSYKSKISWQDKLKILIKLKLKIINNEKEFEIVFFQNEVPDFIVNHYTYECNQNIYKVLEDVNLNKTEKCVDVIMEGEAYQSLFKKIELKEHNEAYKNSLFESILMENVDNMKNDEEKETFTISFWELYNPELNETKLLDQNFRNLMSNLYSMIEEIYNKNKNKFYPFVDIVDEVKDQAIDYYNTIPVPMSLNLIKSRLKNNYYISIQSIEFDLELILLNAGIYNPENSRIVKCAQDLVKEIKIAINFCKNNLNSTESNIINLDNFDYNLNRSKLRRITKGMDDISVDIFNDSNNNGRKSLRSRTKNNIRKNSNSIIDSNHILELNENNEDLESLEDENYNNKNSEVKGNYLLRNKRTRSNNIRIKF